MRPCDPNRLSRLASQFVSKGYESGLRNESELLRIQSGSEGHFRERGQRFAPLPTTSPIVVGCSLGADSEIQELSRDTVKEGSLMWLL